MPYSHHRFDVVIITVGFGEESKFDLADQKTYWSNDGLHQYSTTRDKTLFVSGTGDGGLIDTMRLALLKFDHGRIVEEVMQHKPLLEVRDSLLQVEEEARALLSDMSRNQPQREAASSNLLWRRYNELKIPERVPKPEYRQNYKRIILNSPLPTPMNLNASIIDRVIIHRLMADGVVAYEGGRLAKFHENIFRDKVHLERAIDSDLTNINQLIIRHGPLGALRSVISDAMIGAYFKNSALVDSIGRFEAWHSAPFKVPEDFDRSPSASWARAKRLKPDFSAYLASLGVHYRKLGITNTPDGDGPAFIVTLEQADDAKLKDAKPLYERIPIIRQIDTTTSIGPRRRPEGRRLRPLVCGSAIGTPDSGGGTLGCFVIAPGGKPALITAGHILGRHLDNPEVGAPVLQPWLSHAMPGAPAEKLPEVVGTVTKVLALARGAVNRFDIGYATLADGVEFVQICQPHFHLPAPRRLIELDPSAVGKTVWVVSADNLLSGKVTQIEITLHDIDFGSRSLSFEGAFFISDLEGDQLLMGNSGGIVMLQDGSLVGMVFGGLRIKGALTLVAFPLAPALKELGCQFIPFTNSRLS